MYIMHASLLDKGSRNGTCHHFGQSVVTAPRPSTIRRPPSPIPHPPSVRACHFSPSSTKCCDKFCFRAHSATALTRYLEPAVRDISPIQLLADLLPERVGSLLSLNALREDLDASPEMGPGTFSAR